MSKSTSITKRVYNETETVKRIYRWLDKEENIYAPGNKDDKYTGEFIIEDKKPDAVFWYKDETFVIVEAKRGLMPTKKTGKGSHAEAEKQLLGYMNFVSEEHPTVPIMGLSVSLDRKTYELKVTGFWKKGTDEIQRLKIEKDYSVEYLISQTRKAIEGISEKKKKILGWKEIVSSKVATMHEHVRNYCSASGDTKMNLLYGVLLALNSEDFRKNMNKYTDEQYSRNIYNAIVSSMVSLTHDRLQTQNIKDSFAFLDIDSLPINKVSVPSSILNTAEIKETEISFSKFICNYIEIYILAPVRKLDPEDYSVADVASVIYNEFLKYNKADAQDLGIVLTPEHICDLMIKLLDLKHDDVLLDVCTGTGAFLVAGVKNKIENSSTAMEETISCGGVIGVELQNHMYAAAIANLVFNGVDISNLYLGSCYDKKIIEKIKELKPTKAVLNPPYSMYKNSECDENLNELGFVSHALSFMPKGGKVAAIIPSSCGIKDGVFEVYRDEILKNHRLDAVIECNPGLFVPAANVATSIYVFTAGIPHEKSTTMYVDARKDGYKSGKRGVKIDNNIWSVLEKNIITPIKEDEPNDISRHFKTKIGKTWDSTEDIEFEIDTTTFKLNKKEFDKINNPKKIVDNKIDTSKWALFKIVDLFDVKRGSGKVTYEGEYNLVTASSKNNGINGKSDKFDGENKITCASNGAPGYCFYQEWKFKANADVIILSQKFKMTKNIGLFMSTVMSKSLIPKYGYNKKLGLDRISKESILLPSKNGQPDWEYMEEFMNNLKE